MLLIHECPFLPIFYFLSYSLGLPVPCVDNLPRHPGFLKDLTINSCLLDLWRSQTPPKPTTLSQHPLVVAHPCRAGIYLFGEIWCLRSEICSIWIYNLCYKSAWINFLIYLIAVFIWFQKWHQNIIKHVCCAVLSCFSRVQLLVTLWTVVCQAPLSMGFSRPEYWSGLPCPPPGDLPNSGIELAFLMCPAMAGWFFTSSATWEAPEHV